MNGEDELRNLAHGQLHHRSDFTAVGRVGPETVKAASQRWLSLEKCAHGRSGFRSLGGGVTYADRFIDDAQVGNTE